MEPFTNKQTPKEKIGFGGKAVARISTKDNVAKVEEMKSAGVTMTLETAVLPAPTTAKFPGLGPGGLGGGDKNNYTCSEDSLEYQTSWNTRIGTVKLKRVKP